MAIAARINKERGGGSVILGSDAITYGRISSGSLGLDVILGGGWTVNAAHEIVGEYSSGKTALAYMTIAKNQKINPDFEVVWVAAEEFNADYARSWGVDTDRLMLIDTNLMEEAYNDAVRFAEERAIDLIVIDSLPVLIPLAEDEKDIGGSSPGRGAFVTGQFFRKVRKASRRSLTEPERPITLLVINQYTHSFVKMGDPRVTTGGRKKDYAYSTRVEVARDEWISANKGKTERPIGQTVRVKTIKNKTAPQRQLAFYDLYFDHGGPVAPMGIDYAKELVLLGTTFGIIQKKGSWFSYKGQQWQGATSAADGIRQDGDLIEPLEREVLQVATRGGAVLEIEADEDAG